MALSWSWTGCVPATCPSSVSKTGAALSRGPKHAAVQAVHGMESGEWEVTHPTGEQRLLVCGVLFWISKALNLLECPHARHIPDVQLLLVIACMCFEDSRAHSFTAAGTLLRLTAGMQDSLVAGSPCSPATGHRGHVGAPGSSHGGDAGPAGHRRAGGRQLHRALRPAARPHHDWQASDCNLCTRLRASAALASLCQRLALHTGCRT